MDDFGIAPSCSGSMTSSTAGPKCEETTKSSASLEIDGVSEIGRRCLLMSLTFCSFGMGLTTSPDFQG